MIISRLDKQGVHFPHYGQVITNLDFIDNLREQGVVHVYLADEETKQTLFPFENFGLAKKDSLRPPCRKPEDEPTDDENMRPGVFSPGNNLMFARKIRQRARNNVKSIFDRIIAGDKPDLDTAKSVADEFVSTCLYKNEVFMNMLLVKETLECEVNHAINVSILSIALGRRLGLPTYELENLGLAGLLHDVGMLTMPEYVYRESSSLSDSEFKTLMSHSEKGFEMLKQCGGLNETVLQAVLQHHEKANGTGYPEGLLERQITKNAKIISIADTYDTITSDRPYSKGRSPVQAIKMIFGWSGKHFNETLVKFFVSLLGVYPVGTILRLETNEVGIVYEVSRGSSTKPKILVIIDESGQEVEPFPVDLNNRNILTGQPLKAIKETLTPDQITTDIFSVLEKYLFNGN